MTDLELVKACAEAMGHEIFGFFLDDNGTEFADISADHKKVTAYNPLTDDAQAMAMVKRFKMSLDFDIDGWFVVMREFGHAKDVDLNRAICLCVARMAK